MINKKLINRIETFMKQIPPREDYIEKYFRKLKSEGEIEDYQVLGVTIKTDSILVDVNIKDYWYRLNLEYYNCNGKPRFVCFQATSLSDFMNPEERYRNNFLNI